MRQEYKNVDGVWKLVDVVVHAVYYTTSQGMQKMNVTFSNVTDGATGLMKLAQLVLANGDVEYGSLIVSELKE